MIGTCVKGKRHRPERDETLSQQQFDRVRQDATRPTAQTTKETGAPTPISITARQLSIA